MGIHTGLAMETSMLSRREPGPFVCYDLGAVRCATCSVQQRFWLGTAPECYVMTKRRERGTQLEIYSLLKAIAFERCVVLPVSGQAPAKSEDFSVQPTEMTGGSLRLLQEMSLAAHNLSRTACPLVPPEVFSSELGPSRAITQRYDLQTLCTNCKCLLLARVWVAAPSGIPSMPQRSLAT
ncbi:hypothetical protein M378DRAFT_587197 [Amanita muscaria Koide BX008]|uniref:Uncharacterized protein n=1 Tax=Amanita muscaria (strain Koide BX008) TaxID=946122 RepID=A0A0C2X5A4_AMAMK|nr:hypothetical protein M378DRAFT_587197 [Amanita muscaria Koide BX008]